MDSVKQCINCHLVKLTSEFHLINSRSDKFRSWCIACAKVKSREWNSSIPNKTAYYKAHNGKPQTRYAVLKYRAKSKGTGFDISFSEWLCLIAKPCHYCGIDLQKSAGSCLDRIDNSQGYLRANVLPCCKTCNSIRGNKLTVAEMEVAMMAILSYRAKSDKIGA